MSDAPDEQAIRQIIADKNVTTLFQPIVSIPAKSVVGLEAYSRGGDGNSCDLDPTLLFNDALPSDIQLEVDQVCREKAFKQFKPIHDVHEAMLLFVNTDPRTLDAIRPDALAIPKQAQQIGINPGTVVIEGVLRDSIKGKALMLGKLAKEAGFRLCLDNCATDDAFSHAISLTQPHFVKINRSFFAEDQRKEDTAQLLDILVKVAYREGTAVIAIGVESEEESIRLLAAGVYLQQGYYYTRGDGTSDNKTAAFYEKISNAYDNFKRIKREIIRKKKDRMDRALKALSSVSHKLSNLSEVMFEGTCRTFVGEGGKVGDIFSIFVLNKNGEQLTRRCHIKPNHGCLGSTSILGSAKGADHSMNDYVLSLDMGYTHFVTQPFRSTFNGEEACLFTKRFFNYEGGTYTVCIEVPYPG